jgi:short-subunit dehydrogenase
VDALGGLDIAVNNAAGGGHGPTPLAEVSPDQFRSALAISLESVFLSLKFEAPAMLESGGGAIVNMASTASLEAVGGLAGYVAAKHGVIGLTRVAALDYAAKGVRVNAIALGPILTERLEAAGEDAQRTAGLAMPMRRIGQPSEVASAAVWLCSDLASFVTGATLIIDGGKLAGTPPSVLLQRRRAVRRSLSDRGTHRLAAVPAHPRRDRLARRPGHACSWRLSFVVVTARLSCVSSAAGHSPSRPSLARTC